MVQNSRIKLKISQKISLVNELPITTQTTRTGLHEITPKGYTHNECLILELASLAKQHTRTVRIRVEKPKVSELAKLSRELRFWRLKSFNKSNLENREENSVNVHTFELEFLTGLPSPHRTATPILCGLAPSLWR